MRRSRERPPGIDPRQEDSLLRKYQALLEKHERLIEKQRDQAHERSAVFRLAWWALQTSFTALALVSEDRILVANARWHELQDGGKSSWCVMGEGEAKRRPRSVRAIAVAEARSLLASSEALRVIRLEHQSAAKSVLDLRLERPANQRPPVVLAMARDITADLAAERALAQAREGGEVAERLLSLGQLTSGVVHDLSSSLGAMKLRLQMLESDPELVLRHGRNLEALGQIVADALARVTRLHDLIRQHREAPLEPVRLTEVIADAIELCRTEVEGHPERPIRLTSDVAELPEIQGNAAELRFVLMNLLLNARDAMPESGTIRVMGRVEKGAIVIRVEDEGTGIPPENLERIFTPFFSTKGRHGSGLGLAMAAEVMARLGGTIRAANRPKGGAVFTLTFPQRPPPQKKDGDFRRLEGLARESPGLRPAVRPSRRIG